MFQNESDNYPAEQLNKIIVSGLYDGNDFVGYTEKILFRGGYYHKKIYNNNKQLLSYEKFAPNDLVNHAEFYQDGKVIKYIEADVDSAGQRHVIVMDENHKTVSHKKFDKSGRFIGGGIYENGKFIGSRTIKYTEDGAYETDLDARYRVLTENKKIDPAIYAEPEPKILKEVVLEIHIMSHTKNGAIYETVFDGTHNIISKPQLVKNPPQATKKTREDTAKTATTKTEPTNTAKTVNSNKIMLLIQKILHIGRGK